MREGTLGRRGAATKKCLRSQKPSVALVESNNATTAKAKKVSTLREPAQLADLQGALCVSVLLNWQTCRGHSVSPPNNLTLWRRLRLDLLLWQRSSNLSDSCFSYSSDFAFAFHRAHNPCSFTGGFSMEGAPFYLQRRPQQQCDGRDPTCWSPGTYHTDDTFQLRADVTVLRSTLLVSAFGRISSPPAVLHGPLRSENAQTPSIRSTLLVSALGRISFPPAGRMDHSAAELPNPDPSDLFAPRSASMLHCTSPRAANTSPKIAAVATDTVRCNAVYSWRRR